MTPTFFIFYIFHTLSLLHDLFFVENKPFIFFYSLKQHIQKCLIIATNLFSPLGHRTLMKSSPESIQVSVHSFFEAAAADLEMTVENLSVTMVCLTQSRSQQARGVAKVLSHTTSILLPTLTALFQHLGIQNSGVDLLGKGFLRVHPTINSNKCNLLTHHLNKVKLKLLLHVFYSLSHFPLYAMELEEQLVSTPLKSLGDTHLSTSSSTSLKPALIKCLSHGHRAAGAYCPPL